MNTFKWLLKREYWEHKGGFFWAPAVVGALIAVGITVTAGIAMALGSKHGMQINGEQVTNLSHVVDAAEKARIIDGVSQGYLLSSAPLFIVLAVVAFFFYLGSLFDERKDRSVLFWKSLPVSDAETVVSKAATGLVVAPLVTIGLGLATSLVILVAGCIYAAIGGLNLFGVFAQPGTWLAPFLLVSLLPVYVLWALPTVGWLMMVSAWARTKVFLWAVGVPVIAGVLLSWTNGIFGFDWNVQWFWHHIVGRGLLSAVPGAWFAFSDPSGGMHHDGNVHFGFVVAQSWKSLATLDVWLGAAVGAAMLYVASRLRRWKDEG